MTSYINFTALTGAGKAGFLCYLLEIDEAKILLDCGWTEDFNTAELEKLKDVAGSVDAVLLSHSTIEHVGGLAYAVRHCGLGCNVYATYPVQNMGQLAVADAYCGYTSGRAPPAFDLRDVERAFDNIKTLRYRQREPLPGKALGISITPHNAGHSLGGTLWKITKDTEEIVYAVDFNHKKEHHLSSAAMMTSDVLNRPSILITSSQTASALPLLTKKRDQKLVETAVSALRSGGSVLIPVDVASRALEVALVLDQHWSKNNLPYPITVVSPVAKRTFRLAKSMLEYMNDALASAFSQSRDNPLQFRHVNLANSLPDDSRGPQVILASSATISLGSSRQIFEQWCTVAANVLLLVQRGIESSLARVLYNQWRSLQPSAEDDVAKLARLDTILTLVRYNKQKLEGEELLEYLATHTGRANEDEKVDEVANAVDVDGVLEGETSDEGDNVAGRQIGQGAEEEHGARWFARQPDLYVKNQSRLTGGFFRGSQSYRMFPVPEVLLLPNHKLYDDFGEAIDYRDYARAEFYLQEQENAGEIVNNYRSSKHTDTLATLDTLDSLIDKADGGFHLSDLNALEKEQADLADGETSQVIFKYGTDSVDLPLQCLVTFIDMEGLADGPSVKNVLSQIQPKKVIFIRGAAADSEILSEYLAQQTAFSSEVLCAEDFVRYNVSSAASIWQLRITDACFRSLQFEKAGNVSIGGISGQLLAPQSEERPVLELAPVNTRKLPPSIMLGQVSLNAVKLVLSKMKGIVVEYGRIKLKSSDYAELVQSSAQEAESAQRNAKTDESQTVIFLKCFKKAPKRLVCILYKYPKDRWIFHGSIISRESQSIKRALSQLHIIV